MSRRIASTSAGVLDEWGDPVRYQDVELPPQDLNLDHLATEEGT